ncbi:MAG: MMPL family transporter [Actinomycetota bacterium]
MSWERLADFVLRRPWVTLAISLAVILPPLLGLLGMKSSVNELGELPSSADSVRGFQALEGSIDPGEVQPAVVIIESKSPIWEDETFAAIDLLTVNLGKIPAVTKVRSITRPTAGRVSPEDLEEVGLGDLVSLADDLPRADRGLGRIIDGVARIRGALRQVAARIPGQRGALAEGLEGIRALRDGVAQVDQGIGRLRDGLAEARDGIRSLADEVADRTLASLRAAWADLRQATIARGDPEYGQLAEHVGTALGAVSGRCPDATGIGPQPPDCPAGERVDPNYEGLSPTLRTIADGLGAAVDGLGRISIGLDEIDAGLAAFEAGLVSSQSDLARLEDGAGRMVDGLDRIIPGLRLLRRALAVGLAQAQEAGLLPDPSEELAITASIAQAFPKLRNRLEFFVDEKGTATRVFVTFGVQPYSPQALEATREIDDVAALSLRDSPLQNAIVHVTGPTAFFADVEEVAGRDFRTITWVVVLGIFLVLVILLRSLIAPIYMVLTVLLSFASTLGLTAFVFQGLLGEEGLVWWLPSFLFVILVALGADYNIFLTTRIREETRRHSTKRAVARGLAATGHVITSAGLILAGTFAALLPSSLGGLVQMGFAASVGLLIDTFIVRSLLVPSIAVLAGRWSWWPSRRIML